MKAIVVTDQAAGTAGMKLVERPEPQAAINDVVVQVHASGFTWDELTWPSTWTDRLGRLQPDGAAQGEDNHPPSSVSDTRPSMHAAGRR